MLQTKQKDKWKRYFECIFAAKNRMQNFSLKDNRTFSDDKQTNVFI